MPRKRIIYDSVDECLRLLLNNPDLYKNLLSHRSRLKSLYEDTSQFDIVNRAITLFQIKQQLNKNKIKDIL